MSRRPHRTFLSVVEEWLRTNASRRGLALAATLLIASWAAFTESGLIGREMAVTRHLQDGEEYRMPLSALLDHGQRLFSAKWTVQDGGGRPETNGIGEALTDPSRPLLFPRNFNRVSGPDSNACAACHNSPHNWTGGNGDFVAVTFVQAQRFDDVDFDAQNALPLRGSRDELGAAVTLASAGNARRSIGMFGSGYVELLARQMTTELQRQRDTLQPGQSRELIVRGVSFGRLKRIIDGRWDVHEVEGLPAASTATFGSEDPPSLLIQPFSQAGAFSSLRLFTDNALNHHHGIQASERFGKGRDPDGDGFVDEVSRADVTALVLFQATLPVPGQVIPHDSAHENAIALGEARFKLVGCVDCHRPSLELDEARALFIEPGPHNPRRTLRRGEAPPVAVDLADPALPLPRLQSSGGRLRVPLYSDLKLHDITNGPADPNREPIDMQQVQGTAGFFGGNSRFLTRPLWGVGNQSPYFHHGRFTTLREAIEAHAGEAQTTMSRFRALPASERDAVIEFLKSLQVLPAGVKTTVVDENYQLRSWDRSALVSTTDCSIAPAHCAKLEKRSD